MKPILLFSTILSLMVINFSCLKESIDQTPIQVIHTNSQDYVNTETVFENFASNRNGIKLDIIYYPGNATTDNYLLSLQGNNIREHGIYHKNAFDSTHFTKMIGAQTALVGGNVTVSNYDICHYKNSELIACFTAIAEYKGSEYYIKTVPNTSLLLASLNCYKVNFKQYNRNRSNIFNPYRINTSNLHHWEVKRDTTNLGVFPLTPMDKSLNWQPLHKW